MVEEAGGELGIGFSLVFLGEGIAGQRVIVMRLVDFGEEKFW